MPRPTRFFIRRNNAGNDLFIASQALGVSSGAGGARDARIRESSAGFVHRPSPRGSDLRASSRAADAEARDRKRADDLLKNLDLLKGTELPA